MQDKYIFTIEEVEKKIEEFTTFNVNKGAFSYLHALEDYLKEAKDSLDSRTMEKYKNDVIVLKFLSLEELDNWEEIKFLIKDHYDIAAKIKYLDLWKKIKINLLTEPIYTERDKIKEDLKNVLLKCGRPLLSKFKYQAFEGLPLTVADWLRDYNANLGIQKVDNLKKVQYLTNSKNISKLDKEDKDKIVALFDLYERLKYSSTERYGFEDNVPMIIDGKLSIFSDGEAEVISDEVKNILNSLGSPDSKIDLTKTRQPLAPPRSQEEIEIKNLEEMAEGYELGSLERRAIEEEIRKMKLSIRYQSIKK